MRAMGLDRVAGRRAQERARRAPGWAARRLGSGALALMLASAAHGSVLHLAGSGPLSERQVAGELRPALRQPGDSLALARALETLMARYQGAGYLDARIEEARWSGDSLHVVLVPGARVLLRELKVQAADPQDSARVAGLLGLSLGEPASPQALADALERAMDGLEAEGRAYAMLGVSAFEWDDAGARAVVSAAPGPVVTVSAVRFRGLRVTRPALALKSVGRVTGLPYNPAATAAARARLQELGLFRRVELEPLEGESDWRRAQLVFAVEEPSYNSFEGALGLQGAGRTAGLAHLTLGNLLGTGRGLELRWEARGNGVADFVARYREPLLLGTRLQGEASLLQNVQDTLFTRTRWGGRLRYSLGPGQGADFALEEERVVQDFGEMEEASLDITRFGLEREGRDDRLHPRRGLRTRLEAAQSFKRERLRPEGKRTARASSVEWKAEWHHPLWDQGGLAFEGWLAGRFSSQAVLPLYERFALGGAASLRGYREEEFRADRLGLLRSELRWFVGPHGERVFAFFDQAWMESRLADAAGSQRLDRSWKSGLGAGLRLESGAGLVGVDYGWAPGRAPLEGKLHLRLESRF